MLKICSWDEGQRYAGTDADEGTLTEEVVAATSKEANAQAIGDDGFCDIDRSISEVQPKAYTACELVTVNTYAIVGGRDCIERENDTGTTLHKQFGKAVTLTNKSAVTRLDTQCIDTVDGVGTWSCASHGGCR